jgi:hypothetical protein
MQVYPQMIFLDTFCVSDEGEWKVEGEKVTRGQFVFERKVVDDTFWLTVATASKSSKAKRIEELVLEKDLLDKLNGFTKQPASIRSRTISTIDLCTATNEATGKIHLFVLAASRPNEFVITSYSARNN